MSKFIKPGRRALATLWVGGELGWIEDLSLRSMVKLGHPVTLYTYGALDYVPEGVTVADAQTIFPVDRIYVHQRTKSPSCHSDIFRMKLLAQTDAVWMDIDIIMIKPLMLDTDYLFAPEDPAHPHAIGNSMLRLPQNSETLALHLAFYDNFLATGGGYTLIDHNNSNAFSTGLPSVGIEMGIADFGPPRLTKWLKETGEISHSLPSTSVYPVHLQDTKRLITEPYDTIMAEMQPDTYGIHLWATRFKRYTMLYSVTGNPEATFNSFIMQKCFQLKANFLYLGATTPAGRLQTFEAET